MSQEKDTISKSACPRCDSEFVCNPSNISACDCSKIELSAEEFRFISSKFTICVCNTCLKDIKDEYNSNFHYNKPNNFKDRQYSLFLIFSLISFYSVLAQTFAPSVGIPGSTAVDKDSSVFLNWASSCTITRGYQDISDPSLGFTSVGDSSMAIGKAMENGVISLGDGGIAICSFAHPITNGPGFDFAVFENSFDDQFLELAFVEVSSDGSHFFRFCATSLSDTMVQTPGFGYTDATKLNNLAGKYRGGYGTPFDLEELKGISGLNINNITHVKIIDVVGSISRPYATYDAFKHKINEPWPTPYPSGGFDLDAIGVMHQSTITGLTSNENNNKLVIYPNPATSGSLLHVESESTITNIELVDSKGTPILQSQNTSIDLEGVKAGMYLLKIQTEAGMQVSKLLIY